MGGGGDTQVAGGGIGGTGNASGDVSVSLTDAPAFGYDNVWITVKEIWFHTDDAAGPNNPAWLKYAVTPHTVDLLTLCNGAVSPAIWDRIKLPVGTYKQIRIILAKTTDSLTASAAAKGLSYNNEIVDASSNVAPLYIPDAEHGIRLTGTFTVSVSTPLRLAIDFNAGDDIVDVTRKGVTEYYLKPRLAYFDLDNAGAIIGTIDNTAAANDSTAQFVFKAEVPDPTTGLFHVVKRYTVWDTTNNQFVIYPLPPGTYDIMMRGIGYETVILKGVPVTKGTTPTSGATPIPTITMTADTDYTVTANSMTPTGSWVNFYQTLPGAGEIPYEIRYRHLNPYTGGFAAFKLSNGQIQMGNYINSTTAPVLSAVTPVGGVGGFTAVQDADLYSRSSSVTVNPTTNTTLTQALFGALVTSTPAADSITGSVVIPAGLLNQMDNGKLFAVHGGMIMNTIDIAAEIGTGGAYLMSNLPGGSSKCIYGVEAFGWSSTTTVRAVAAPAIADLSTGNATGTDMDMVALP